MFFSRRIGLENPIVGGGRLTGQVGKVSVGVLNLQTGDEGGLEGGNHSVARVRADLGPRASIGGLVTNLTSRDGHRRAAGGDAQLRFFGSSSLDVWAARLWDPFLEAGAAAAGGRRPRGPADGRGAGAAHLRLRNARYGTAASYQTIGRDFQPALGFVRRTDQRRLAGELNFTPRFERSRWARQWTLDLRGETIDGQDGGLQSTRRSVDTQLLFQTGDAVGASLAERFERLSVPFTIRPGVLIAPGDYTFDTLTVFGRTIGSRRRSGNLSLAVGRFYSGTRTEFRAGAAWTLSPRFSVLPAYTRNVVSLPVDGGRFTTNIVELTIKSALNRELFGDALIQYDDVSRRLQANIRVNWIHTPGSNLFLVLDTGVNMGDLPEPGVTRWERRTGVVKLTYLWAL